MSEQDASEQESPDDGTAHADAADESDGNDQVDAEQAVEDLEAMAEAPSGDADAALSAILDDEDDEASEDEALSAPAEVNVDEEIREKVENASPETTARAIAMLRDRVATLEGEVASQNEEIEDLQSRLKRKQADFQNYKKRQKKRMEEEKQRATEDLVERLLDVRDNLRRALDQEEGTDIRGGVESTLRQFTDELQKENVEPIEPEPGEDVDPQRHEALATIAGEQPADTIAEVHRPGYEMAGKVIRPAQVAISDGSEATEE